MKMLLPFLAVLALAVSATAAEIKPPTYVPASGLALSLTTGGYKFFINDSPAPVSATAARASRLGGLLPTREGFAACALLANTSRTAIPFEFDDAGAAAVKFKFTVLDADGAVVWQSDSDLISAQVITSATLGKGQRWKRLIQIPLKVDGAWLPVGRYTLEAVLAASPSVSASTIFEVAALPEPPTGDSGISGLVFISATDLATPPVVGTNPAQKSGALSIATDRVVAFTALGVENASVRIEEVRLPNARYAHPAFSWSGRTDANGNFKVITPPGEFNIRVVSVDPVSHLTTDLLTYQGHATVTVEQGKFSSVQIPLLREPPAPIGTGIQGLALIGPVRPVQLIGQSNEQPLAFARIEITEIQDPNVQYFRGPWTFNLTAGADGRFTQATPPGDYRVKASVPSVVAVSGAAGPAIVRFGTGTAEVTVPADGYARVTVHVDSGIR